MSSTIKVPSAQHLYGELQAIASEELASVLASWPELSGAQAEKLSRYLTEELSDYGMLSVSKGRESGQSMGEIRRDARRVLAAIERQTQESAERIDPYNGETDKHYRRAGDLRGFCACGERFTEEHLASLTDGWHDTDDQGNPVCWCGESAEFVNAASDASPEHPCCEKHVQDGYRAIEEPTRVGTFNPLIPDDQIIWESQESQESATDVPAAMGQIVYHGAPEDQVKGLVALLGQVTRERDARAELINGCNLEASLRYAQERIAALERERGELQAKVSSALSAVDRWTTLGHAPAVTADLRARLGESGR
jgi:hypothetical protein